MKHMMIDLETLGTKVDSVFIAVGAVYFDPETGEMGKKFYYNVDWQSSLDAGRKIDASTIKWWFAQSDEARAAVLKDGESLIQVLWNLSDFMNEEHSSEDIKVWGNGSSFDISMLEHAWGTIEGYEVPWAFWNIRDVRTIKDIGKHLVSEDIFKIPEGKAHNALEDAIHQAKYVSALWQALKPLTPTDKQGED